MKYFKIILIILFFSFISIKAEEKKIITGDFSWSNWKDSCSWKSLDTFKYSPNLSIITEIKEKFKKDDFSFYIFAGSWCGDSESEVPKIFTILNLINIKQDRIKLMGVDRDKDMPNHFSKMFAIMKVPTVIILKNDSEIGRIIEFPQNANKNWEEEINSIISR